MNFTEAQYVQAAQHALARIPHGVTVRASNTLLVRLLPTNTVTLIGSNVDHGDWAIIDTVEPGCSLRPADVPLILRHWKT